MPPVTGVKYVIMTRRCAKTLDFVTGLGVGLLISTATALLLAELKYYIEQGHASRMLGFFPSFDDAYGGDRLEIGGTILLDEMISRAHCESEGVHERRMFREHGIEHQGDTGGSSVFYDEE
jgi:hypothetical protein